MHFVFAFNNPFARPCRSHVCRSSENTEDYDDRDERNDREADEHAGAEGESQMPHNHVEVESQNEHVGKHEEGEGEQGDEEGGAGEDGGDAEEEAGSVPDVKPELSWEMTQAMAYRLSKKRTIRDVGLLARAELKKLGPAEGMMVRKCCGQKKSNGWWRRPVVCVHEVINAPRHPVGIGGVGSGWSPCGSGSDSCDAQLI